MKAAAAAAAAVRLVHSVIVLQVVTVQSALLCGSQKNKNKDRMM